MILWYSARSQDPGHDQHLSMSPLSLHELTWYHLWTGNCKLSFIIQLKWLSSLHQEQTCQKSSFSWHPSSTDLIVACFRCVGWLVASQKTFYSRQNIRCQLFRERNPSCLALGKITTIQSAWSGQGIFKAVFWNLTLIFTSFNEGAIIWSDIHPLDSTVSCGGCGKLFVLRDVYLILDSSLGWARPYSAGCG